MKNLKKNLALFFVAVSLCAGLAAQTIKPKVGYKNLKWGSTTSDAKKSGFALTPISKNEELYEPFVKDQVDLYMVSNNKDKDVYALVFAYHNDRLFSAMEFIQNASEWNLAKLQKRYGKLIDYGDGNYNDEMLTGAPPKALSIMVGVVGTQIGVRMFDWTSFSQYTKTGRRLSGKGNIVESLDDIAKKLLQSGKGGKKPSYAFLTLTTDDRNALIENYVTDALTEAVFNTNAIRIVERSKLEKVLTEQKFQNGGLVNESSAKEIGNLTGADYVCYGTVKDLGTEISLNVRVVDVATGELCAMGRANAPKDTYLSTVGYEAAGNGKGVSPKKGTSGNNQAKSSSRNSSNNQWKVEQVRNKFDGCTVYTFTTTTPENYMVIVGLKKYDNSIYSKAYCGVSDNLSEGKADIKDGSGQITTKQLGYSMYWYLNGHDGSRYKCRYEYNTSTKWLFDICLNSDTVVVRDRHSKIARFQTAGLEEKMAEVGLTPQDFYNAYGNEEF